MLKSEETVEVQYCIYSLGIHMLVYLRQVCTFGNGFHPSVVGLFFCRTSLLHLFSGSGEQESNVPYVLFLRYLWTSTPSIFFLWTVNTG